MLPDIFEPCEAELLHHAAFLITQKWQETPEVTNQKELVKALCQYMTVNNADEIISVVMLDEKQKLICSQEVCRGKGISLENANRSLFITILTYEPSSVLIVHNRPVGQINISKSTALEKIIRWLNELEIELIDYVFVQRKNTISFADEGVII